MGLSLTRDPEEHHSSFSYTPAGRFFKSFIIVFGKTRFELIMVFYGRNRLAIRLQASRQQTSTANNTFDDHIEF